MVMLHQHFYGCSVGFALVCIITFFAYIVAKKFREIPFPTLNRMYWRLATGHLLNQNHYMWEWSSFPGQTLVNNENTLLSLVNPKNTGL